MQEIYRVCVSNRKHIKTMSNPVSQPVGFPPPLPPLPQSNGVNITIINPTTNVMDAPSPPVMPLAPMLMPNPADSFTPLMGNAPPLALPPSNG